MRDLGGASTSRPLPSIPLQRFTNRQVAIALNAFQQFRCANGHSDNGRPYSPGFFDNTGRDFSGTLLKEDSGRNYLDRVIGHPCITCGATVGATGLGDHAWPLSRGGIEHPLNRGPFCASCNVRKGRRDLLEFWMLSGNSATDLPDVFLWITARLMVRVPPSKLPPDEPAALHFQGAMRQILGALPSSRHRAALLRLLGRYA